MEENCEKCDDFENLNCEICKENFYLENGMCQFNRCDSVCLICIRSQCLSCKSEYIIFNGQCINYTSQESLLII